MTCPTTRTRIVSRCTSTLARIAAGALALVSLGACGKSDEPGIKAIEDLAPFFDGKTEKGDCIQLARDWGEHANTKGMDLVSLPSRYSKDFADRAKVIKEKYGSRLAAPCGKILAASDACHLSGAMNMSGHGQNVIDLCAATK